MTERKFTDEEVIKALELCFTPKGTNDTCAKCPYHKFGKLCKIERDRDALDLINRQRAEIEGLKEAYAVYEETSGLKQAKAEAIKEFAKRLHKGIDDFRDKREMVMLPYTESALLCIERKIDNITKELTESKPCTEGADCFAAEGEE